MVAGGCRVRSQIGALHRCLTKKVLGSNFPLSCVSPWSLHVLPQSRGALVLLTGDSEFATDRPLCQSWDGLDTSSQSVPHSAVRNAVG